MALCSSHERTMCHHTEDDMWGSWHRGNLFGKGSVQSWRTHYHENTVFWKLMTYNYYIFSLGVACKRIPKISSSSGGVSGREGWGDIWGCTVCMWGWVALPFWLAYFPFKWCPHITHRRSWSKYRDGTKLVVTLCEEQWSWWEFVMNMEQIQGWNKICANNSRDDGITLWTCRKYRYKIKLGQITADLMEVYY